MIRVLFSFLAVASAVLLCPSNGAAGQEADQAAQEAASAEILDVAVGLGGRYRAGCWTPVRVALRYVGVEGDGELALIVPDGDGVPSRVFTPLPCPAGDPRAVVLGATSPPGCDATRDGDLLSVVVYTRFGRVKSELAVELRVDERLVDRKVFKSGENAAYRPAILSEQEMIVTVGRAPLGVEDAVRLLQQDQNERTVAVRVEDFSDLPTRWYGYEGVDAVVLSTSDPEIYADLPTPSARLAALDEWIRMGGRLVVCAGEQADVLLGDEPEGPLARFLPGRLKQMVPLRRTGGLETFVGSLTQVPALKGTLRVPHLVDVQGSIEAQERNLPLVVRGARGFGQVVFLAADPDRPPLAEWEDRGRLMGRLLDYSESPVDADNQGTAVMHYGFADLAGQLRSALDHFPKVWLAPFSLVVAMIVVYILAIGPGDYFLLRKLGGRMRLTWVTFPLLVALFGGTAYLLACRLKGDQVRVNQADLVDVDVASGRVRGTAWANVFSPRTDRYQLSFQPRLPGGRSPRDATTLTAWLGLPGRALGGMNPGTAEPAIWKGPYDFSPGLDALRGVPIQIWSTKSVTARWSAQVDNLLEARLVEKDHLPRGTITNTLGFPLTDCLLAYGAHAYELGRLEPDESVRVGSALVRRELKSLLTSRQIIFVEENNDYRPQATQYDQSSVDTAYILRAMMFYDEAGGRRYTGLSDCYQGFVDFSHLLKTKRAVLIGHAECSPGESRGLGAELLLDGQPVPSERVRRTTVFRFVLPVERGE